ncbi:polyprenyl synt and ABC tran domain containing pr otein, partial [Trichuris trichiura]
GKFVQLRITPEQLKKLWKKRPFCSGGCYVSENEKRMRDDYLIRSVLERKELEQTDMAVKLPSIACSFNLVKKVIIENICKSDTIFLTKEISELLDYNLLGGKLIRGSLLLSIFEALCPNSSAEMRSQASQLGWATELDDVGLKAVNDGLLLQATALMLPSYILGTHPALPAVEQEFQQDDYIDCFNSGNKEEDEDCSDIATGKVTWPLITALEMLSPNSCQWNNLWANYGIQKRSHVEHVKAIYAKLGVKEKYSQLERELRKDISALISDLACSAVRSCKFVHISVCRGSVLTENAGMFESALDVEEAVGPLLLSCNVNMDFSMVKFCQEIVELLKKKLLVNADLRMYKGKRYGLVGRNGVGKTTLLRMISSGNIQLPSHLSILHVEQEVEGDDTLIIDSVLQADTRRQKLLEEEGRIREEMGSTSDK